MTDAIKRLQQQIERQENRELLDALDDRETFELLVREIGDEILRAEGIDPEKNRAFIDDFDTTVQLVSELNWKNALGDIRGAADAALTRTSADEVPIKRDDVSAAQEVPNVSIPGPNQGSLPVAGGRGSSSPRVDTERKPPNSVAQAPAAYKFLGSPAKMAAQTRKQRILRNSAFLVFSFEGSEFKAFSDERGAVTLEGKFEPLWTKVVLGNRSFPLQPVKGEPDRRCCSGLGQTELEEFCYSSRKPMFR